MGLEIVELVLAIEEQFDIQIPNKVAEKTRTPGELIQVVIILLNKKRSASPFLQTARDRLILLLHQLPDQPLPAIDETSNLRTILSPVQSRHFWVLLQNELGERLPQLDLPWQWKWASSAMIVSGILLAILPLGWLIFTSSESCCSTPQVTPSPDRLLYVVFAMLGILLGWERLGRFVRPWIESHRCLIPASLATMNALAEQMMFIPPDLTQDSMLNAEEEAQVHQNVKRIMIEQLGIKEIYYRENASFVDDLGMG